MSACRWAVARRSPAGHSVGCCQPECDGWHVLPTTPSPNTVRRNPCGCSKSRSSILYSANNRSRRFLGLVTPPVPDDIRDAAWHAAGRGCNAPPTPSGSGAHASHSVESGSRDIPDGSCRPVVATRGAVCIAASCEATPQRQSSAAVPRRSVLRPTSNWHAPAPR